MTPAATIAHHVAGRTRFRILSNRGDGEYFVRLRDQLRQCPGVVSVTTTAVTGSVLVLHDAADHDVLVAYARTFDLFEVAGGVMTPVDSVRPPAEIVNQSLERLDQWVRSETSLATDLRSVALTGLVAAAVWQLLRGQVLPAAGTLLWYALAIASHRPQTTPTVATSGDEHTPEETDLPVE